MDSIRCKAWLYPGRNSWDMELKSVEGGRQCKLPTGHEGPHDEINGPFAPTPAKLNMNKARRSVLQDWVHGLSFMQQSVLICSVRGPDGIRKDHPVKVLCRYLRRSILICAFDGRIRWSPYEPGGGSFTGPLKLDGNGETEGHIDKFIETYLRHVDELPHHFQLHFMHAAEILGYKHPDGDVRGFWYGVYAAIVNDAHLRPEPEEVMDQRLGDVEAQWRAAEEIIAEGSGTAVFKADAPLMVAPKEPAIAQSAICSQLEALLEKGVPCRFNDGNGSWGVAERVTASWGEGWRVVWIYGVTSDEQELLTQRGDVYALGCRKLIKVSEEAFVEHSLARAWSEAQKAVKAVVTATPPEFLE